MEVLQPVGHKESPHKIIKIQLRSSISYYSLKKSIEPFVSVGRIIRKKEQNQFENAGPIIATRYKLSLN